MERRADLDYIINTKTGMCYPYSHDQWLSGNYREPTYEDIERFKLPVDEMATDDRITRLAPIPDGFEMFGWDDLNDYIIEYRLGERLSPYGNLKDARADVMQRINLKNADNQNFAVLNDALPANFNRMQITGLVKFADKQGITLDREESLQSPAALRTLIKSRMLVNLTGAEVA